MDLCKLSASQLLAGYERREFSPVDVAKAVFARIEKIDGYLHAYLALNQADAMAAARQAEKAWLAPGEKPLLCGVPVSVKDTIEMAGMPTTYGSLAFKDNMRGDAELVRRLRQAGAVILGKTNTPEFALAAHVTNRLGPSGANPWNLQHTCGGSSGGAAAAVAAGLGPIGIGTDSAGSVRGPAAYNGIFGLKPTMQRIPSVQAWRAAPGRSHNGPLTRTVRDAVLTMQALAGPDPRDPDSQLAPENYLRFREKDVRGARIAVSYTLARSDLVANEEMKQAVDGLAHLLKDLGCKVELADPPQFEGNELLEPGVWAYSGDHYSAGEGMIPGFWEKHQDDLTDYARVVYDAGRRALAWKYRGALRRNRSFQERMKAWFASYDFMICPGLGTAPRLDAPKPTAERGAVLGFLGPFNHSHNPVASIPCGFAANGLPIAAQLVGPYGNDLDVLRMSAVIEGARPWGDRWPDDAAFA
ncbi:MAG TPA: amidase [Alphaproteobacteria bacterium]